MSGVVRKDIDSKHRTTGKSFIFVVKCLGPSQELTVVCEWCSLDYRPWYQVRVNDDNGVPILTCMMSNPYDGIIPIITQIRLDNYPS